MASEKARKLFTGDWKCGATPGTHDAVENNCTAELGAQEQPCPLERPHRRGTDSVSAIVRLACMIGAD